VALYFMHVRESPPLTRIAIAAGLVWLVILFGLALSDYATRDWLPVQAPPGLISPPEKSLESPV
jgi:hypothetical protein